MRGIRSLVIAIFMICISDTAVSSSDTLYDELIGTWQFNLKSKGDTIQMSFWPQQLDLIHSKTKRNMRLQGVISSKGCANHAWINDIGKKKNDYVKIRGLKFPDNRPGDEFTVYAIFLRGSLGAVVKLEKPACQQLKKNSSILYIVKDNKTRQFAVSYNGIYELARAKPNTQHTAFLNLFISKETGSALNKPLSYVKNIVFNPDLNYGVGYLAAQQNKKVESFNKYKAKIYSSPLVISKAGLTLLSRPRKEWRYHPVSDLYYNLYKEDLSAAEKDKLFYSAFVSLVQIYGKLCGNYIRERKTVITRESWTEVKSKYAGTYNKDHHTSQMTVPTRYKNAFDWARYYSGKERWNISELVSIRDSAGGFIRNEGGCESDNVKQLLENYYRAVSLAVYKRTR